MREIEKHDEMARKALSVVAYALNNNRERLVWTIPRKLTKEEIQNKRHWMKQELILMLILMIWIFFETAILFLLFSVEGEINDNIVDHGAIFFSTTLVLVVSYLHYLSMEKETRKGWIKVEYELHMDRNILLCNPSYKWQSYPLQEMDEFPYAFPLPFYSIRQDHVFQQYIHEQIEKRTGLPVTQKE